MNVQMTATMTIQKHSCRPPGATNHARNDRREIGDPRPHPRLANRHPPTRQRALRFVHAIDFEVVNLIERVVASVEDGRYERTNQRIEEEAGRPRLLRRRADGGQPTRKKSQSGATNVKGRESSKCSASLRALSGVEGLAARDVERFIA